MIDCKDYTKLINRGSGYLVYIPKSLLELLKIDFKKKLLVKRYATKDKQIILRFKEV
jgi:hypothetical protein